MHRETIGSVRLPCIPCFQMSDDKASQLLAVFVELIRFADYLQDPELCLYANVRNM